MKNRNRWIMLAAMLLAFAAVALDYIRHPAPEKTDDWLGSVADEQEQGAPCSMDSLHEEGYDEEEL